MDAIDLLVTPRLHLRPLVAGDAAALLDLLVAGEAELRRRLTMPATLPSAEDIAERIAAPSNEVVYGVFGGGELLGSVTLEARGEGRFAVATWIAAGHAGRGLATEATAAVARAAFALGAERLEARCGSDHPAAEAIVRRLGFRVVAVGGGARVWMLDDGDALAEAWPEIVVGSGWSRLGRALRAHADVVDIDEAGRRLTLRDRYLVGGRNVAQNVDVSYARVSGRDWLVLAAAVAPEHAFDARAALAHNAGLAAGALSLVDDRYVLRDAVPLEAIGPDDVLRLVALVGHEAARLRQSTRRAPVDAAFFESYAA